MYILLPFSGALQARILRASKRESGSEIGLAIEGQSVGSIITWSGLPDTMSWRGCSCSTYKRIGKLECQDPDLRGAVVSVLAFFPMIP